MDYLELRTHLLLLRDKHMPLVGHRGCNECGMMHPCVTYRELTDILADVRPGMLPVPMGEFLTIGHEIGGLVEEKNQAYGDSYGKSVDFLKLLFPNGIPVEKYEAVLFMARVFDKLMRVATDPNAFGEHPYGDIGGYAIRAEAERRRQQALQENTTQGVPINLALHFENAQPNGIICNHCRTEWPCATVRRLTAGSMAA